MKIRFEIDITVDEKNVLKRILDCKNNGELSGSLFKIAKAALSEYLEMLLGKQLPTRANEIRERRLYHLIKNYFDNRIPSEAEISSVFQLTESDSRSLLRNVRTKFKYDLESLVQSTIRSTLEQAKNNEQGNYRLVIQSENILEELRQTVALEGPNLDQIQKVRSSAGVYIIPSDTYVLLCKFYGIDLTEQEAVATREG